MVPVENPLHGGYSCYYGYGGCGGDVLMSRVIEGYEGCNTSDQANNYCLGLISSSSDHQHHHHLLEVKPMAEDESRTTSSLNDAAASSSKDAREERLDDEGWLELSIGGRSSSNDKKFEREKVSYASDNNIKLSHQPVMNLLAPERGSGGLVELDLLPPGSGGLEQPCRPPLAPIFQVPEFVRAPRQLPSPNFSLPFNFFQHPGSTSSSFPHSNQEIQWAYRPNFIPANIIAGSPPSSSSLPPLSPSSATAYNLMPFVGSYFARPVMAGVDVGGSSSDVRVVNAPRRPHSGIWFMLQASQNQAREPFLPQIPKSYLRIKDGKMTVRLLMKYLVNKLSLDSESEIEIRCRGQELQPCLTLQHVRDNIWSQRDAFALLPPPDNTSPSSSSSTSSDHLMVLHYGRSAAS
ncbi:protein LAX PANICLE 2-like isoform X2 [Punica granatum]|uniref:Protein LAX PANICLE 2-like isoform X2 n=1 Tax=Punica granatum TaxID=22663 RepID=A0A6P8DZ69_PUNGR|nr:protein LAX PANICLE 2-like isoform X2 [Punica granatum]